MKEVCVLVPAFNEEGCLETSIGNLVRELNGESYEILIYNDGSTDRTAEIAQKLAKKYSEVNVHNEEENKNLAAAFDFALNKTSHPFLTWSPADGEIPAQVIRDLINKKSDQFVVYTRPSGSLSARGLARTILSSLYQKIFRISFKSDIHYFNGSAIYPRNSIQGMELISTGFTVNAELLIRATHRGFGTKFVDFKLSRRLKGHAKALSLKSILFVFNSYIDLLKFLRFQRKRIK